jgi:hypothetical protein
VASLPDIAEGIAATAAMVPGLRMVDHVPSDLNPPAGFVTLVETVEDTFGLGSMASTFELVVLVSLASERVGQRALLEYADNSGTRSVWAVFASEPDLGLSDGTNARIAGYRTLGIEEIAGYGYYGGAFTIQVTSI